MSIKIIKGNIFTSKCQTLVNTVNCVGVMGAGIALECRLRYPEMYEKYVALCEAKKIDIGLLWLYKSTERWVLNFPTKKHWKAPSEEIYLHSGLQKFAQTYVERNIKSIAFPLLGADRGGISAEKSLEIMQANLEPLNLDIEIYRYDPNAKDDIYEETKLWLLNNRPEEIAAETNLRKDYVIKVLDAVTHPDIHQLNQLAKVPGVGIKTLNKLFSLSKKQKKRTQAIGQQKLF